MNLDRQTTRSVEIPACGSLLLGERTDEHLEMFEQGKEADFFSTDAELLEKCKYYLGHENERRAVAYAGHKRCVESGYSNQGRIESILRHIRLL